MRITPNTRIFVRIELRKRAPDIQLDIVSTLAEALGRLDRFRSIYGAALEMATIAPTLSGNAPRYDLVLTDLNLPDGSGKTLLAQVRSQPLPLPVVVLTGSGSEEILVVLLREGADDYVIKRSNFLDTLALVLRAALDKFHTETFRRAAALRILYIEPNAGDIDLARGGTGFHCSTPSY